MSMTEILNELPQLDDGERQAILQRLLALDATRSLVETPEMVAAIDAGIESFNHGRGVPLEEARQRLGAGAPSPIGALSFAREHGLEEGSTDVWMKMLRQGEEDRWI